MSRLSREESVRPQRIPVADSRAPLVVKGLDQKNFYARWVLDVDDRIQNFLNAGYEFVNQNQIQSAGSKTVETSASTDTRVSKPAGRGLKLYLMRQPRKFYDEDRRAKDKEIDLTEESIRPSREKEGANFGKVKLGHSNSVAADDADKIDWSQA